MVPAYMGDKKFRHREAFVADDTIIWSDIYWQEGEPHHHVICMILHVTSSKKEAIIVTREAESMFLSTMIVNLLKWLRTEPAPE